MSDVVSFKPSVISQVCVGRSFWFVEIKKKSFKTSDVASFNPPIYLHVQV